MRDNFISLSWEKKILRCLEENLLLKNTQEIYRRLTKLELCLIRIKFFKNRIFRKYDKLIREEFEAKFKNDLGNTVYFRELKDPTIIS